MNSHLGSLHLEFLDLEQFAFGHGAEFDLGANRRWVADVVDFPEELGHSVGPFADYSIITITAQGGGALKREGIITNLAILRSSDYPSIADRCC